MKDKERKAILSIATEAILKASFRLTCLMGQEYSDGLMALYLWDTGNSEFNKEKDTKQKTEGNLEVFGKVEIGLDGYDIL